MLSRLLLCVSSSVRSVTFHRGTMLVPCPTHHCSTFSCHPIFPWYCRRKPSSGHSSSGNHVGMISHSCSRRLAVPVTVRRLFHVALVSHDAQQRKKGAHATVSSYRGRPGPEPTSHQSCRHMPQRKTETGQWRRLCVDRCDGPLPVARGFEHPTPASPEPLYHHHGHS